MTIDAHTGASVWEARVLFAPGDQREDKSVSAHVKVGLLGAAYILHSHAMALAATPSVSLHAVWDLSHARAAHVAAKFKNSHVLRRLTVKLFTSYSTPALHVDAALTLAEAGKPVFLEKPMGLDRSACAALCARFAKAYPARRIRSQSAVTVH